SPEGRAVLVLEIARTSNALPALAEPLGGLLGTAGAESRARVCTALASIRTRESVRLLITEATSGPTPGCREAAFAALARLTGRSDLGSDSTRWSEWFAGVEFLTEPAWQRTLAEGLADAADRAARERDSAVSRLTDANGQRYLDTPQGESRWALLASLLRDDLPRVRRQGVAFVKTELANARQPGGSIAGAAIGLLRDPYPDL